ncbi:MAG TPA: polysaccharide pyruvyl transferase family protein [Propionicimonas sp.]|jgi:hypothetical protein
MIGVMGVLPTMPNEFPIELRENAGNMIHGNAPFEMFPDIAFYRDPQFVDGRADFSQYVNSECTHLLVTLANTLRLGDLDPKRYLRFQEFLEKFTVPVVIFGMGAQARRQELIEGQLPPAAIDLMKYLGDHTESIGVRGEFTAAVFEHYAGVTNTFVTGCPSFFSRPFAFDDLATALAGNRQGRASYSGQRDPDAVDLGMLVRAITQDTHLIEVSSAPLTAYAQELQRGVGRPALPKVLASAVASGAVSRTQVERYFASRFQLFRDPRSWYKFNQDCVGFAYGTRFHVNMAALLSGVPALWFTHDSRTEEFTNYLRLPAIPKEDAAGLSVTELRPLMDYSAMYEALPRLFGRFNQYLATHGLPAVALPIAASEPPAVTTLGGLPPQPKATERIALRARSTAGTLRRRIQYLRRGRSSA